jgi:hypothetical protein
MGIVEGALIGGTVLSGMMGNKAAKKGAQAQTYAADQSTQLGREQLEYIKSIMAPYQQEGQKALPALSAYVNQPAQSFNFDYGAYFNSPEYAALSSHQNEQALRMGSATGGIRGGDTQAALATIAPQLAQQARQNAQNEFSLNQGAQTNRYNQLMGIAGLGTGAANQVGNAAQNFGQAAGNNALMSGNALANSYLMQNQNNQNMLGGFGQIGLASKMGLF